MKSATKIIFILFIITVLLMLGFYRDYVFKNINALLKAWDYDTTYSMPTSMKFLEHSNYNTLLNLKWLLTLLFSIIYCGVSCTAIYIIFKNKKYIYITIIAFISVVFISAFFIGIGYVFKNSSETMYEFARYLMGMAQSPIILMILIPAFKLSKTNLSPS